MNIKTANNIKISKRQLCKLKRKIREGKELRLYRKTRERMEKI